ncbi:MAG: hypothetical protein AAFO61_11175 [Pseudomonadota bacterium]
MKGKTMIASSFIFQINDINASQVAQFSPTLVVTARDIAESSILEIQEAGTDVFIYINVAVTEEYRPFNNGFPEHDGDYWQDVWTIGPGDTGDLNPNADLPDWLEGRPPTYDKIGYIVDYGSAAWEEVVYKQIQFALRPQSEGGLGANGIYLDDLLKSYEYAVNLLLDYPRDLVVESRKMIDLVNNLVSRAKAEFPDVQFIYNGNPEIITHARLAATAPEAVSYLEGADYLLLDNYYRLDNGYPNNIDDVGIARATENFGAQTQILALERSEGAPSSQAIADFINDASQKGFIPFVATDPSYDSFNATLYQQAVDTYALYNPTGWVLGWYTGGWDLNWHVGWFVGWHVDWFSAWEVSWHVGWGLGWYDDGTGGWAFGWRVGWTLGWNLAWNYGWNLGWTSGWTFGWYYTDGWLYGWHLA